MPAQRFTVHIDPDDLARQDLAAGVPPLPTGDAAPAPAADPHSRVPDRDLPARARRSRPPVTAARSYAFRRH
jgi:hypothetical protein